MSFSPQEYQRALSRRRGMGSPAGDQLRAQADVLDSIEPGSGIALRQQAAAFDLQLGSGATVSAPLSTNAKIGIGLGGAVTAGALAYALWPKKRRKSRR